MINFKLGDQPFSIPVSWREVTVGQFKRLLLTERPGNLTEVISILTGVDYDLLFKTVRPVHENKQLAEAAKWAGKLPDFFNSPLPEKFFIGEKEISYKKDITVQQFGQYSNFLTEVSQNAIVHNDKFYCNINDVDKAICIYCYPDYSGQEFSDKWVDMIPVIDSLPFLECYAVASFFLNRFNHSLIDGEISSTVKPAKKKRTQVSKTLTSSE